MSDAAKIQSYPRADHGEGGRFVEGNEAATKHGFYSDKPIIRELLSEAERKVWDSAPVPARMDPVLEITLRTAHLMRFRVFAWVSRAMEDADEADGAGFTLVQLATLMDVQSTPERLSMKAMEVTARLLEADANVASEAAVEAYLRALPARGLGQLLTEGEMPLLDPRTGELVDGKATGG